MRVEIERTDDGHFLVWKDGKHSGSMIIGEMLEQTISLLEINFPRYAMKTPEEWAAERKP